MAVCAVPYLRKFAEEYRVELPDEREIGWHLLRDMDPYVSPEERDRFRMKLYDGKFFSELEVYEDCPAVLEQLVAAGHELYFITARAERRRMITETWLREKGLFDYAKAVHLKPLGEFRPDQPRRRSAHRARPAAGHGRRRHARRHDLRSHRRDAAPSLARHRAGHREASGSGGRDRAGSHRDRRGRQDRRRLGRDRRAARLAGGRL